MNVKKAAQLPFAEVIKNFPGNEKTNYEDFAGKMFSAFHYLGCKMSIKTHFIFSCLGKFPENLRATSDEQRERFSDE